MQEEITRIILIKFLKQVLETSKKYGVGLAYVYGQFNEACHQLQIKECKEQYYEF